MDLRMAGPRKPGAGGKQTKRSAPRRSDASEPGAREDRPHEDDDAFAPADDAEGLEGDLVEVEPAPAALEEETDEDGVGEVVGEDDEPLGVTALAKAGARGLARRDPLQVYMDEVHRHPILDREEEVALARHYRETGDLDAAYRLVASNLRLVVKLAHEYHRNPLQLLDLVQEGNVGLMHAVKKYDPERGVKLSSYAAWWIRAYILRYIMDNWKLVKLGTTEAQRKLFFKLRQEQRRLLAEGFEASPKLLAERLDVTEQDVVDMDQRLGQNDVSLDAPLGDDEGSGSRSDHLETPHAVGADDRLASAQLRAVFREKLGELAETLNEKERYIFEHRLTADEPMTLQDIGRHFGFSRERARQLEAALIARMREHFKAEIPDFELIGPD